MKKLMKAIAFATVMCMLLSTAAFATSTATMDNATTVTVKIEGADANQPLAVVVTPISVTSAAAITSADVKYIDQKTADGDGYAEFTVDTKGENGVNVFYGYAGAPSALKLVATAAQAGDVIEIVGAAEILNATDIEDLANEYGLAETDTEYGSAAVVEFDVELGEGRSVTDMFWSITYTGAEGTDYAYYRADASIFNVLEGGVKYAIAFSNGNRNGLNSVEITAVNAIFKTANADGSGVQEILTNPDDEYRRAE